MDDKTMKKLTTEQRDEIFKAWEDSQEHEDGGYFAEWVHDNTEQEEEETMVADFIKKFKELQESGVIKSVRRTGTYTGQQEQE